MPPATALARPLIGNGVAGVNTAYCRVGQSRVLLMVKCRLFSRRGPSSATELNGAGGLQVVREKTLRVAFLHGFVPHSTCERHYPEGLVPGLPASSPRDSAKQT